MIPKLEFSFVTSQEKFDIMTSVPEKSVVEIIGQQIKDNRSFHDNNAKLIFEDELNRLMFSRARGVPKKMKKPVKQGIKLPI
jgi:hypothetical protein